MIAWEQHFVDFMGTIPGGYGVLGILGGLVVLAPWVPKVLAAYRAFKKDRNDAKAAEIAKQKAEEEQRIEERLEDREFKKKISEIIDGLPGVSEKIAELAETSKTLAAAEINLKKSDEMLTRQITSLSDEMKKFDDVLDRLEEASSAGDKQLAETLKTESENLHNAISENAAAVQTISKELHTECKNLRIAIEGHDESIKQVSFNLDEKIKNLHVDIASNAGAVKVVSDNLRTVVDKVNVMVESDLDSFRNYLLSSYKKYVQDKQLLTKDEIELLCMGFKKYKKEGGNGWAEKLYYEILQCQTVDGVPAETIAKQFRYLVEKTEEDFKQDL